MIKLVILDVDGILTDGKKYYDSSGKCFAKTFCDKDWTTIKRFKSINIPVVFLTGDANINESLANNRNIHVIVNRKDGAHKDKSEYIDLLCEQYNCNMSDVCYFGDDLFDIGIMRKVGHPYCVTDSPKIVKKESTVVEAMGGDNAVLALFELLENQEKIAKVDYESLMSKIYILDNKEVF